MLTPAETAEVASRFGVAELAALASLGALSRGAAGLFRTATGRRLLAQDFTGRPPLDWHQQLAHQTAVLPPATECLSAIRRTYGAALGWT